MEQNVISTGIEGLDRILGGGLPGSRLYLVQGAPGTGKTTFGLQFLLAGEDRGEKVVYVTLSQSRSELEQIARSHGWSLDGVLVEQLETGDTLSQAADQTIFHTADIRLDRTRKAIEETLERHSPTRIVYDSLLEIRQLAGDSLRFRQELLSFKSFLAQRGIAALMIDTETQYGGDSEMEGTAHGIFCLDKSLPEYGVARRRIEVKKMRGVAYWDGYHDMAIRTGGVEVYPRIVPNLAPETQRSDLIKSNIGPLDAMLDGGLEAGTTTLIVGQAGTGKSTLASIYSHAALERGEGVAMFLFEERLETFFRRSEGLGMNLRHHEASGRLQIRDFNPAEVSPGEFSQIVQQAVEEHDIRVVLIDSFTGYLSALPKSDQAVMQIQSLVKYLSRRGVLSMLVVANHGLLGHNVSSDVDVSFLGDAVLLLRMYEWPGLVRRSITVVKKRHGPHDINVHELLISPEGIGVQTFNPPPLDRAVRFPMPAKDDPDLRKRSDRVLLAAPFRRDAELIREMLLTHGIATAICPGADELSREFTDGGGSPLILSQEALTPRLIEVVAAHLSQQPAWSELPLVLLLDSDNQTGSVLGQLRERLPRSKLTVLQRPVRTLELATAVQTALAARRRQLQLRDHIEWQAELHRELNHRVKNVLSNVIAIYHMTLRQTSSLEDFAESFEGRLSALSRVHSALAMSDEARPLAEIAELVLTPYQTESQRIVLAGPVVPLGPQRAVTFALCLHELATNAAKYGALSTPSGKIKMIWRIESGGSGEEVCMQWAESGGPAVAPPSRRGYGTSFIESVIKGGMAGAVRFDYQPDGFFCEIIVPLASFQQMSETASRNKVCCHCLSIRRSGSSRTRIVLGGAWTAGIVGCPLRSSGYTPPLPGACAARYRRP